MSHEYRRDLIIREGVVFAQEFFETTLGPVEALIKAPEPVKPVKKLQVIPTAFPGTVDWVDSMFFGAYEDTPTTHILLKLNRFPLPGGKLYKYEDAPGGSYYRAIPGAGETQGITPKDAEGKVAPILYQHSWCFMYLYIAYDDEAGLLSNPYMGVLPKWGLKLHYMKFQNVHTNSGKICMGDIENLWNGRQLPVGSDIVSKITGLCEHIEKAPFNNDLRPRREDEREVIRWREDGTISNFDKPSDWRPPTDYIKPLYNETFAGMCEAVKGL